uniref:Metalloendopeptidase n=1 Tax=Ditylenchus dipsaci TaxID=166011 RepID=A0A915D7Q1_9BILA
MLDKGPNHLETCKLEEGTSGQGMHANTPHCTCALQALDQRQLHPLGSLSFLSFEYQQKRVLVSWWCTVETMATLRTSQHSGGWMLHFHRISFVIVILLDSLLVSCKESSKRLLSDGNKNSGYLFYDMHVADYETVLTPADFEMALEINDYPYNKDNNVKAENSWDSEAMYNFDKFEGDIANDLNASTVGLQLWGNAKIPYAISSQYSSYSRSVIASAMQEYSKHTCIQWTPRSSSDRDYVYIMPERGCYSMVGRTGGRQTLSLGNGCIQKGIILHEMMHAVGFFHEQSRTDRDEFITIMWNNIVPGMQGQFEKYTTATVQTLGSDYDYSSIMHYGPSAFSRNGMPTIVPRRKATIGQRSGFSKTDSYKINTLYECPNYGGIVPTNPATNIPVPQPVATLVPATTTTIAPILSTRAAPPPNPSAPESCRNSRPDCDSLAKQGWCQRNPGWMREFCPVSCNLCGEKMRKLGVEKPESSGCEDLRVDCYCITAKTFTRTYCARSCGFCFVPPVTEMPDKATPAPPAMVTGPTAVTKMPLVTFWPSIRPDDPRPTVTEAPPSRVCRDKKHFCVAWKKAGFCQGIFVGYMKKNCPAACGWC